MVLQHDIAELLRGLEQGLGGDCGVQLLPLDGGRAAELTGRDLRVLGLYCRSYVSRRQPVIFDLVRIDQIRIAYLGTEC